MPALGSLLKIAGERAAGPAPTYSLPHILIVLIAIGETKSIGRQALANKAGLGEGAIRTILKRLGKEGYMEVNSQGCKLTAEGDRVYSELKRRIPRTIMLSKSELTVGKEQVAIVVRGVASRVSGGIEQRDAAIKMRALGATTYTIKDSKFQIPMGSSDCETDFPSDMWAKLRGELQPNNGDVVIVCGSNDQKTSTLGVMSAALSLIH